MNPLDAFIEYHVNQKSRARGILRRNLRRQLRHVNLVATTDLKTVQNLLAQARAKAVPHG